MYESDFELFRRGLPTERRRDGADGRGPDVQSPRWVGWAAIFLGPLSWPIVYFWAGVDFERFVAAGGRREEVAPPLDGFWLRRVVVQSLAAGLAWITVVGIPFSLYLDVHIPTEIYKHGYRVMASRTGPTRGAVGPGGGRRPLSRRRGREPTGEKAGGAPARLQRSLEPRAGGRRPLKKLRRQDEGPQGTRQAGGPSDGL